MGTFLYMKRQQQRAMEAISRKNYVKSFEIVSKDWNIFPLAKEKDNVNHMTTVLLYRIPISNGIQRFTSDHSQTMHTRCITDKIEVKRKSRQQ